MPKRQIQHFAPQFGDVTRLADSRARTDPCPNPLIEIPCETHGQAFNIAQQFRQYWSALRDAHNAGRLALEFPQLEPLYGIATSLSISAHNAGKVKGQGPFSVRIVLKSQLATPSLISKFLAGVGDAPTSAPAPQPHPETPSQDDAIEKLFKEIK